MSTTSHQAHPLTPGTEDRIDLLLIDEDPSDVFLVEKMLAESGMDITMTIADGLGAARAKLTRRTQCIIVDLSAPDTDRLEGLREVLAMSGSAAVVVLTGLNDSHLGVRAVAAGAEDYLVKQEVDGPLLARAIRYSIERKRAEETERRLVEARILGRENARLERGLLPVPLIDDPTLQHHARYRPGRRRALLGGDFYDTVQTEGGAVHLMIGDVSGHGPDEAALGVQLRMAWRTLVLAGHGGEQLLGTLDTVLGHERRSEEIFTTLCMITIAPSGRTARMHLAGHPAPLLFRDDGGPLVAALPEYAHGPALGLVTGAEWPTTEIDLGEDWGLMLYTDGLIEGRIGAGAARLGTDGLVGLARRARERGTRGRALIDELVAEVEQLNGDALTDDLAVLLLTRRPPS
ncbi:MULTISPECIES: PP2C family protein-serine/threonine phosphatase [Thermomonosporaceae]|uniref:PP2C family protein-serine/threonine phosphatase n=1 Tax=Thermomonosporaceae TaxID=2012 RepID=UPI00255B348E|nr:MULTISPECIES: SpoIIE family protein phosphatase [Thermomonosporaceae]MDL4772183.1 SpoIIE family protein phosphatase [Actinomadura xylanilytica]